MAILHQVMAHDFDAYSNPHNKVSNQKQIIESKELDTIYSWKISL